MTDNTSEPEEVELRRHFGNVLIGYSFGAYELGEAIDKLVTLSRRPAADHIPDVGKMVGPAPSVGWRVVPVEPTPEMIGDGGVAMFKSDLATGMNPRGGTIAVYRAMLAAAPDPSSQGGEDRGSVGIAPAELPSPTHDSTREPAHVFLDCDGVLADFDAHALAYFDKPPRQVEAELGAKEFWRQLEARGDFFRSMPVMAGARELVDGVRHLHPTILTGCPRGNWAQGQKVAWAAEHFPGLPIITCRSADKRDYAKPGDVLIDDWPQHRHRWIEMGGHFIIHHDAETSLAALWAHYPALKPPSEGSQTPPTSDGEGNVGAAEVIPTAPKNSTQPHQGKEEL